MIGELVRVQPIYIMGMAEQPLAGFRINRLYVRVSRIELFKPQEL